MIRHRGLFTVSYIFATAFAVAIICLGSLINFHQYKIWGKPLIPQFVGIKRDVDESGKTFVISQSDKSNTTIQKLTHGCDMLSIVECVRHSSGTGIFINVDLSQTIPFRIPACSAGLRAPPLA
jgi:hypothetical protein